MRKLLCVLVWLLLCGISHAQILTEGFESGNTNNWDIWLQNTNCCTDTTIGATTGSKHSGTYGLDIFYNMDNVPPGGCDLSHQDNNTCLMYTFAGDGVTSLFVRGYVRFPLTAGEFCYTPSVQRKLVYFKPTVWNTNWSFFVNMWPWPNCSTDGYNISVGYGSATGQGVTLWGDNAPDGWVTASNHVYRNIWYYLEIEFKYGATYGTDELRIWLGPDGETPVKILDRTNLTLRSASDISSNAKITSIEIGRQIDSTTGWATNGIYEHRYWDDIVLSATGPVGVLGSDTTAPTLSGVSGAGFSVH